MKLRNSIIAIAVLSGMSYAGGDIGGVTTFENDDYVNAEVQAVEPAETMPVDTASMENIPMAQTVDEGQVSSGGGGAITTPKPRKDPKTPPKKAPKKVVSSGGKAGMGAYIGLAVSRMAVRSDDCAAQSLFTSEDHQDLQLGVTGVIGYNFMEYLGAELRAALSVTGENDGQDNLAEYGIYLKPQYTFNNNLNVYGLLGYSFINMSDPATSTDPHDNPFDGDNSGFSFGAGVDYGITQNISVFTDVVNYLRDFGGSNSTWGANLGVKYHF